MMAMRGNSCALRFRKQYFMNVWEWTGDESLRVIYHKIVGDRERKEAFQWFKGKEQVGLRNKNEKKKKKKHIEVRL